MSQTPGKEQGSGQSPRVPEDAQIDPDTARPVDIAPDGEKEEAPEGVAPPEERLRIDPDSRIPRPVQPDLA